MNNLQMFREYLAKQEKSNKTIEAYMRDINQFMAYAKENKILEFHNDTMKAYKEYLLYERFLSPTSANRKLVAIHQFFAFIEVSATTTKVKIQSQNFLENVINKADIENIIDIAKAKKDYRTLAIVKTLELTGLRISEMLQLQIKDIHSNTIQIVGKGNKIRSVFIPKALNDVWLNYCRLGRMNKGCDYLFVGTRGHMTRSGVDKVLKKYGKLANVKKEKNHAHSFRHQYAKRLIDSGLAIDIVADLCGHGSIETTRIYTRKSKEELLNVIEDLD